MTKGTEDRPSRPWSITTTRVVVGINGDAVDVQEDEHAPLGVGELVDLAVEFTGVYATRPQFRVLGDFKAVTGHEDLAPALSV